jgi:hypothetical protein
MNKRSLTTSILAVAFAAVLAEDAWRCLFYYITISLAPRSSRGVPWGGGVLRLNRGINSFVRSVKVFRGRKGRATLSFQAKHKLNIYNLAKTHFMLQKRLILYKQIMLYNSIYKKKYSCFV